MFFQHAGFVCVPAPSADPRWHSLSAYCPRVSGYSRFRGVWTLFLVDLVRVHQCRKNVAKVASKSDLSYSYMTLDSVNSCYRRMKGCKNNLTSSDGRESFMYTGNRHLSEPSGSLLNITAQETSPVGFLQQVLVSGTSVLASCQRSFRSLSHPLQS